jgi:hypothetical protein
LPVHAAEHDPLAFAEQVPEHVPAQAAFVTWVVPLLALQLPVQLPPHEPEKLALQPASHVPDHVGAVHVPEHVPLHCTAADAVHEPWHEPVQLALGAVTSHSALQEPLQPTSIVPPVHVAGVTVQFACASHEAWTLALAVQEPGATTSEIVTPAARSALMYVDRTPHALPASVCVVSRPSAPFISLQVASHFASRFVAAVPRSLSAVCHARMVACALDADALSPLQPAAACWADWAALQPLDNTARAASANAATVAYLKLLGFVIGRTPCGIEATPRRHLDAGSTSEPETRCNRTAGNGPRSTWNAPEA